MDTGFFGQFNDAGEPTAFFSNNIHEQIPDDAVEISQEDWLRYLSGNYIRNNAGQCVEKPPPTVDLPAEIARCQALLKQELNQYITSYYEIGTQASIQALYSLPETSLSVKTDIEAVWFWIRSIMTYYYGCKTEIGKLTEAEAIAGYTWDFSRFDATRPSVTLGDIYAVL